MFDLCKYLGLEKLKSLAVSRLANGTTNTIVFSCKIQDTNMLLNVIWGTHIAVFYVKVQYHVC